MLRRNIASPTNAAPHVEPGFSTRATSAPGPSVSVLGRWSGRSGKGWVYASSISYQPAHPAFADDVPYVLAIIELDEGVRMHSNVVGVDPKEVEIGMRVEVVWDDVTPEFSLPKFRPIQK